MILQLLFKTRPHHSGGFGLLGVVLLILFLSLGATGVLIILSPALMTEQNHLTVTRAASVRVAIHEYQINHGGAAGSYPPTLDSLVTNDAVPCLLDNDPTHIATYLSLQGWCGPYLDQKFQNNLADFKTDGWGTVFQYNSGTSVITSCGPDRNCGTGDDLTFGP